MAQSNMKCRANNKATCSTSCSRVKKKGIGDKWPFLQEILTQVENCAKNVKGKLAKSKRYETDLNCFKSTTKYY